MRERADDQPQEVPLDQWTFVDAPLDQAARRHQAQAGLLYEFHYEARNPKVQGWASPPPAIS